MSPDGVRGKALENVGYLALTCFFLLATPFLRLILG